MNRTEFLEQLERLLWDIPESERKGGSGILSGLL